MSPELADERRHNLYDPVESDESDVDEGDTVLDHAPNWANGVEADARDGLRQRGIAGGEKKNKKKGKKGAVKEEEGRSNAPLVDVGTGGNANANEECKLVLVVRTDLGMTKGTVTSLLFFSIPLNPLPLVSIHKLTRTSLPLPQNRQNSSTMLPRNPSLLQDYLFLRIHIYHLARPPPALGAPRPSQDRSADEIGRRAAGADGEGAQPGHHGRGDPGRGTYADRPGEPYRARGRACAQEPRGCGYGGFEVAVMGE